MQQSEGTNHNFFERVYHIARQIPYGRVTSYGAIAKVLGSAKSARMVGWAMNACHNRDDVPAHRVVNRVGLLSGKHHFPGTNLMQQLLENEGIKVKDLKIVDFKKHFWDPAEEMGERNP
jgi:methylated-DNA-protein-cysteine methyltransferase-like protein